MHQNRSRLARMYGSAFKIIEEFFQEKFDPEEGPMRDLRHFDGYAHWLLMYVQEGELLQIMANREPFPCACPTMEVGGFFCDEVSLLSNDDLQALVLKPKGTEYKLNYVVITKLKDGRMSFATTVGKPPFPPEVLTNQSDGM